MTDREIIVKWFEFCRVEDKCSTDCPYCDNNSSARECTKELAKDILSLLKEQESIKPYIDIDEAKCPICKVKLTRQELLGEDVLFEDFFDYCPRCGRKVKWQ